MTVALGDYQQSNRDLNIALCLFHTYLCLTWDHWKQMHFSAGIFCIDNFFESAVAQGRKSGIVSVVVVGSIPIRESIFFFLNRGTVWFWIPPLKKQCLVNLVESGKRKCLKGNGMVILCSQIRAAYSALGGKQRGAKEKNIYYEPIRL